MAQIWTQNTDFKRFPTLKENKKTDVVVIGAGMAGILTAFLLSCKGVDTIVLEGDSIASGVSKNTTAKITSQHGLCYNKLIDTFGVDTAKAYLTLNEDAVESYRKMCSDIECDFEDKSSFVYSFNNPRRLHLECEALSKLGFDARFTQTPELPFQTKGAVEFLNQGQFNPLKFIHAIAQKLTIFENSPVRAVSKSGVVTDNVTVNADYIIVATHFPFLNRHGGYFLKLYQERSYVLALENAKDVKGMYISEDEPNISLRNYGDKLLLGGVGHRTGKSSKGWQELEKFQNEFFKNSKEVERFATQDCMTLDGMPYVGRYSARTKNLFVATGFNKWGMTSSMVSAKLLCDMILERQSPFEKIFSPSRSIFKPQLLINSAEAVMNIITPTVPRCPHLGCVLKYNRAEHSWDCPCHGSRFSERGKLINNPALKNIKPPRKH